MSTHFCSFASTVSWLKPRQKRDPLLVLQCLERSPYVCAWEMDVHDLWETIKVLEDNGWIVEKDAAYPWHAYEITAAGDEILAATPHNTPKTD